jgi:lysophospholipase L1-like esterase
MIQFFLLGSSSVYGVGAAVAGWGDLLKQHLHQKMFGENGVGEKYEVYNFAKPGATIDFVVDSFPKLLQDYSRDGKIITIISVGGNNSRADNDPTNFFSTPEEYRNELSNLLKILKRGSSEIIFVGSGYLDESKTNPKPNPLDGGYSYFSNKRRQEFAKITKQLCAENQVNFIDVDANVTESEWLSKYIYEDGLHMNQAGHQFVFGLLKSLVDRAIK